MIIDLPGFHFEIGWLTLVVILLVVGLLIRRTIFAIKYHLTPSVDTALDFATTSKERSCSYRRANDFISKQKKGGVVALIEVKGPILNESQAASPFVRGLATFGGDLGEMLKQVSTNEKLAAVVVRFNTPGGTIPGSDNIAVGLAACQQAGKLTVAYIPELCASGGVWAMVGAGRVIAHKDALLGSIGVLGPRLMQYVGVTELGGGLLGDQVKAGEIHAERLYAGKGKAFGDPFTPIDQGAKRGFMEILENAYERFIVHVAKSRLIDIALLRKTGAIILDPTRALALKLVDELGTFDVVKELVAEKVGQKWDDCVVVNIRLSGRERFSTVFAQMILQLFPAVEHRILASALAAHPCTVLAPWFYR